MRFGFPLLFLGLALAQPDYFDDQTESYYLQDDRVLGTSKFNQLNRYTYQPYVSNGYIGSRIPNLGFGFSYDQNENVTSSDLSNGWPLFNPRYAGSFIAGFFDAQPNTTGVNFPELRENGYESIISAVPQWTGLQLAATLDGTTYVLDPSTANTSSAHVTNYRQELRMATGTVSTAYTWLGTVAVNVTVLAHRDIETLGLLQVEVALVSGAAPFQLDVVDVLDFASTQRCVLKNIGYDDSGIFITVQPEGVEYKHATLYSRLNVNASCVNETLAAAFHKVTNTVSVVLEHPLSVTKYVGVVSDDLLGTSSSDATFAAAKSTALDAAMYSWPSLRTMHDNAWAAVWGDVAVEVENEPYLTLAAEASIYHLFANTRSSARNLTAALGVGGLSSDSYGGMVFWDADLWMIPALLPIAPETSVALNSYRYYMHEQAMRNAAANGYSGAVYPWTSGRFGNCTGTGPCVNYEYHLNGAICYSVWKAYLSGAINDEHLEQYGWPVLRDAADFFAGYVKYNDTLQKYTTHNLTDPDEYANFKDNAAYTAVIISQVMKWADRVARHLGKPSNSTQLNIMQNMYLPQSSDNITLEYDTMNSSVSIKQADVVLIPYIDDEDGALEQNFGYDEVRATNDLSYYSLHQSSQGPAMTFPVFAAVSQKLNEYGCGSQTYHYKSVAPFLRFPFAQMSEQNNDNYDANGGTHPAFPFNTAHGGLVQSYFFGLTGIRFSYAVTAEHRLERVLHFDPVELPLFGGDLKISGFKYLNQSLEIVIGETNATIRHRGTAEPVLVYVDDRNAAAGYHTLEPGTELTVPVHVNEFNTPGSLTECQALAHSLTPGRDGDVVMSIVDGDNSTTWQAQNKNDNAAVLLELETSETFNAGAIVWGSRPAANFSLSLVTEPLDTTGTDIVIDESKLVRVLTDHPVFVASPYNASDTEVRIVEPNSTTFALSQDYAAQFVLLEVYGTVDVDDSSYGASVAELGLFYH
ncbi:hypothetical protein KL919_002036 [Ogataea angusta]|nr:hypothetical protein KL919_002036 [Ogataea angusta]